MRNIKKLLLLPLASCAIISACHEVESTKVSGLVISPQKQYLGPIRRGQRIAFRFSVKNGGNQSVTINDIARSCGCTEAKLQTTELSPGATTELTGSMNSSGKLGEFGAKISLNGKNSLGIPFQMDAYVGARSVVPIAVWPQEVSLPQLFANDPAISERIILKKGEAALDWDDLSISADHLKVSKEIKKIGLYHATFTVDPKSFSIGTFHDTIRIDPLKEGQKIKDETIEVPVEWRIDYHGLEITPKNVYVGLLHPGEVMTSKIRFRAPEGATLEGDSIQIENPGMVKAVFSKGDRAEILWVNYSVQGGTSNQKLPSSIDIRIHYNKKTINIHEGILGRVSD